MAIHSSWEKFRLLSNADRYTMSGTLTLESQLGAGTTFTLHLTCPISE